MNNIKEALQWNYQQNKVYMPNEIFEDLRLLHGKKCDHIAFTYSYYYLICWLFRYTKYGEMKIDTKLIKRMLGYSPDNKKINYIIKKNGLLDQIGYTLTDSNYPISWDYNDGDIEFTLISDMDEEVRKTFYQYRGNNFKVKLPIKAIWRTKESKEEGLWDGTFYEIENTHCIPFDVFSFCLENDNLGVTGFYVYAYFKCKCQWFNGRYNKSIENISEEIGMAKNTVDKYLNSLKKSEMVNWEENDKYKVEKNEVTKEARTYEITY
ncbi:hypothetical protein V1503_19010 [Bacillus sp. SCS-151]|uniref:hypothetical protein n=1 Tax=Nanhaiella sioensis TaxID=3115293 RepID=UPI003979EFD9